MSKELAFKLMQEPLSVPRNKMFTITGYVIEKEIDLRYTKLLVEVTNWLKMMDNIETFEIFFLDPAKRFVDRNADTGDLVDVMGQINVSKKSTKDLQVLRLEGKHVYVYRNTASLHKDTGTRMISPRDIKNNKDLAY